MVMFYSKLLNYQRVNLHFPMVFPWFSYGFPIKTSIFLWFFQWGEIVEFSTRYTSPKFRDLDMDVAKEHAKADSNGGGLKHYEKLYPLVI